MDMVLRFLVGVAASWITPDPAPQQVQLSVYEERCVDQRCHLRVVR